MAAVCGLSPMISALSVNPSKSTSPIYLLPRSPDKSFGYRDWRVPVEAPSQMWLLHVGNAFEVMDDNGNLEVQVHACCCSYQWFNFKRMFGKLIASIDKWLIWSKFVINLINCGVDRVWLAKWETRPFYYERERTRKRVIASSSSGNNHPWQQKNKIFYCWYLSNETIKFVKFRYLLTWMLMEAVKDVVWSPWINGRSLQIFPSLIQHFLAIRTPTYTQQLLRGLARHCHISHLIWWWSWMYEMSL